jgi:MFS family permease
MVNRVIRTLVTSDFILNFAFGLLAPIFAVFVLKNVEGSTLRVIGTSATFYWLARVVSTVPLSKLMDKTDGERDEYYFVIAGSFIISTIPLFFLLISEAWHLYLIQFIHGLANSMTVPSWRILFTDHLDRGRTGYEWSLEDIAIGTSTAASAYVGSVIAEKFGFEIVLILLSILSFIATMFLIPLKPYALTLKQLKREQRLQIIKQKRADTVPIKTEESH